MTAFHGGAPRTRGGHCSIDGEPRQPAGSKAGTTVAKEFWTNAGFQPTSGFAKRVAGVLNGIRSLQKNLFIMLTRENSRKMRSAGAKLPMTRNKGEYIQQILNNKYGRGRRH